MTPLVSSRRAGPVDSARHIHLFAEEGESAMARRRSAVRGTPVPVGLVLPAAVLLLLALGYPLGRQVVLSLQEFGLAQQFGRPPEWIGLDNYRALVGDPYLWKV